MSALTDLQQCAADLDQSIRALKARLRSDPYLTATVFEATDPNGRPILADLLAAQGQVLAAIASLTKAGAS